MESGSAKDINTNHIDFVNNSLTNDDARITKRIFIPSRKLRGFEPGKVGPKDGSEHIGGNYVATLNLIKPVIKNEFKNLKYFWNAHRFDKSKIHTRFENPEPVLNKIQSTGKEEFVPLMQEIYKQPIIEDLILKRIQEIK